MCCDALNSPLVLFVKLNALACAIALKMDQDKMCICINMDYIVAYVAIIAVYTCARCSVSATLWSTEFTGSYYRISYMYIRTE